MRKAGIGNVEAFIAYQKGMEAFATAHSSSEPGSLLPEANRWFDAALEIVPDIHDALYLRTDLFGHVLYNHATGIVPASPEELEVALREIRDGLQRAIRAAQNDAQRNILEVERTLFLDDWTGVAAKLDRAFVPGDCSPLNWMPNLAAPYGWAEQTAKHSVERVRCDPLSGLAVAQLMQWQLWDGQPGQAEQTARRYLDDVGYHPWVDDCMFWVMLVTGQYREHPEPSGPNPEGSYHQGPRKIYLHAMDNDLDTAQQVLAAWQAEHPVDDSTLMAVATALGDRQRANELAGRIDARVGGNLALSDAVKSCLCGAPFDLEATPNFAARIEEAGFPWPPPTVIKFPAKDW